MRAAMISFALAGCAAFPSQGPSAFAISETSAPEEGKLDHLVVELTPVALPVFDRYQVRSLGGVFQGRRSAPALTLGVGDIVGVTIFESAAGGLFIPSEAGSRAGNFVTLPAQEVGRAGTISVPYAGDVRAAGRTLSDVKRTIEDRLRNRAIEPQAVVTLQDSRSSLVSVTGEVSAATRFPITRSGDRVLDAITRAGGSKWQPYETYVTLQRGNRTAMVYFNRLVAEPTNNIYLEPGDTIIVSRETRSFLALGATGQNGQINFDRENLMLSEAVGRAGSILDARGDPGQTYVFRLEDRSVVEKLGKDVSRFQGNRIPVIYHANLREPQGYFLASKFPMHDRDILFVSNSAITEISKVINFIQLNASTYSEIELARRYFKLNQ